MRSNLAVIGAAALAVALARPAAGQFKWEGRVAAGRTVEVKGVNGDVRALASTSGRVEVNATKRAVRSDTGDVRIEVLEHADGVTICAVYPTPPRAKRENSCEPGDEWHSNTQNNDVVVDFEVRVPAGVHFDGRTVNGEIEAAAMGANAWVSTVNGSIEVSAAGYVEATTVNGSIVARLGRADWTGELDFRTVNGGITLYLPERVSTTIRAEWVNGELETDYPVTVTGRTTRRRFTGTIGDGGRALHLSTVNGGIKLKKAT